MAIFLNPPITHSNTPNVSPLSCKRIRKGCIHQLLEDTDIEGGQYGVVLQSNEQILLRKCMIFVNVGKQEGIYLHLEL